ncbi:MAG: hypothetical protein JXQ90_23945 [Cyclobacteriaceae bacterium]
MSQGFKSWSSFYQRINLVFNALIAISLLPFAYLYLEMQSAANRQPMIDSSYALAIQIVGLVVVIVLLFIAHSRSKRDFDSLNMDQDLSGKLQQYYQTQLVRYVLMELSAVLSFAIVFLLRDFLFIAVYVIILFWFSFVRPTYENVCKSLRLSKDERERINNETFS